MIMVMFPSYPSQYLIDPLLVGIGNKNLAKTVLCHKFNNLLYPYFIELVENIVEQKQW